jgi:hypothetical protein
MILKAHLEGLNVDTANMIRLNWHRTGLKIGIVAEILQLRNRLQNESNPTLNNKFKQLKADVIEYLGKKISENIEDHESDVLFEIHAIAKTQFHEVQETVIRDIEATSWSEPKKLAYINAIREGRFDDILASSSSNPIR